MQKNARSFIDVLLCHPWKAIFAALLLCLVFIYGLFSLTFNASPRGFMGTEHELMQKLISLENEYTEDNNLLVVFRTEDGSVFSNRTLSSIEAFTDAAWQLPHIQRVDSVTNFQYSHAHGDELIVEGLVENAQTLSARDIEEIKIVADKEPRLLGYLLSPDHHTTAVNLLFEIDLDDLTAMADIDAAVDKLMDATLNDNPSLEIYQTGFVAISEGWRNAMVKDIKYLFTGSLIVIFLGLSLFFGSVSLSLMTLLIAVLSVASSAGLVSLLGFGIQAPSVVGLLMILMLALADAIHIIKTTRLNVARGLPKNRAIAESIRFNLKPVLITSITTAIGFLSFLMSGYHGTRVMGGYSAFGVMLACLLSLTLLPALMTLVDIKPGKVSSVKTDRSWLITQVLRFRYLIILTTIPFSLASIYIIYETDVDDNIIEYMRESEPFRQDLIVIERHLTGSMDVMLGLSSGEELGISDPQFMENVDDFVAWLRVQKHVRFVSAYTDAMKRLNQNMHGDDQRFYRLPESRDLAAQFLLLYELSLPYGLDLNNQINMDKSGTRIVINVEDLPSSELLQLSANIESWFSKNAPEITATDITGSSISTSLIGLETHYSMLSGAILALIIIGVILLFTFRSFIPGLLCVVMVVSPILITFGTWSLVVGVFDMTAAVSLCMVIGIVVDNAVHYISKYTHARKSLDMNVIDGIHYAYQTVSGALTTNAIVLCAGFGLLMFSAFKSNSTMGTLTVMSIATTLVATFTLLPALLSLGQSVSDEHSQSRLSVIGRKMVS